MNEQPQTVVIPRYEPPPPNAPRVDSHGRPAQQHRDPAMLRAIDKALSVQRPVVLAHIRSVRLRNPLASPDQLVRILERRYLAAITGGGAAVGATAVIPVISTPMTLALSGVETVGFLETTALFAQSVAEVHGIPVSNPDRARMLVMTLMLGEEGTELLKQLTGQVTGKGASRSAFWGEIVTKNLPRNAIGPVLDRLQRSFFKRFGAAAGASFIGKALPFGIGAVIGGAGNHVLGRRVVTASRRAFGPAPLQLNPELAPKEGAVRIERRVLQGARTAGGSIVAGAGALGRGAGAMRRAVGRTVRPRRGSKQSEIEDPGTQSAPAIPESSEGAEQAG